MQAYNYDPVTGRYLSATNADLDPQQPGEFLWPAFSTPKVPPAAPVGMFAAFDRLAGAWRLQPVPASAPAPTPAPPPTPDLAAQALAQAAQLLASTDEPVARYRDQRDLGTATTLTEAQFFALLTAREALRTIATQEGFPDTIQWPEVAV